MDVFRTFD